MRKNIKTSLLFMLLFVVISCKKHQKKHTPMKEKDTNEFQQGTFGYDRNFLQAQDSTLVVLNDGASSVLVSPKYQAKVFTSSAEGAKGKSFGWVNYDAFDKATNTHMNAYGGENRFWLGPEGSKFSLFFKPGKKMVYDNWHTPPPVDTQTWKVTHKTDREIVMEKNMDLQNYVGTDLKILANRSIQILSTKTIESSLQITLDSIKAVGFSSKNTITNKGNKPWTKKTGAPCIWILDMFTPSDKTVIVVPYHENREGKVATTDYFGEISKDRLKYKDGNILFQADGKSRGKLGVPPKRAKNMAGSYDPVNHVLTLIRFEVDPNGTYLNQEWTPDKNPLVGDAVNAYNDGPLEDGSQMGPFYEMESVSPAAFLAPDEKLSHTHSVFHFTGNESALNRISEKLLGVSLEEIKNTF